MFLGRGSGGRPEGEGLGFIRLDTIDGYYDESPPKDLDVSGTFQLLTVFQCNFTVKGVKSGQSCIQRLL